MKVSLAIATSLLLASNLLPGQTPAPPTLKLALKSREVALGSSLHFYAGVTGASEYAVVEIYLGNPTGFSTISVAGTSSLIPVGLASLVYQALAVVGFSPNQLVIPNDPGLLGFALRFQAVLVDGGAFYLAAPVHSGPIIEDSIQ
jgi:hypothetical protein